MAGIKFFTPNPGAPIGEPAPPTIQDNGLTGVPVTSETVSDGSDEVGGFGSGGFGGADDPPIINKPSGGTGGGTGGSGGTSGSGGGDGGFGAADDPVVPGLVGSGTVTNITNIANNFRDVSQILGPAFTGIATGPFAGDVRPDYNPDMQLPQNLAEARRVRQHLKSNRIVAWQESRQQDGQVIWKILENGQPRAATEQEVAQFQFQQEQITQVNDINVRALNFQDAEDRAQRELRQREALDEIQKERDKFLAELEITTALDPRILEQRRIEVQRDFDNAVDIIEAEGAAQVAFAEAQGEQRRQTAERQFELDVAEQKAEQDFRAAQSALDRSLRAFELEESKRQAQVVEQLDRQRIRLQEQQFKMEIFGFLSASPEMLFFMQNNEGLNEQFRGLLQDVDDTGAMTQSVDAMIEQINSRKGVNVQQFAQLTPEQQGIEQFRLSAQTGQAGENVQAALRGEAPAAPALPTSGSTLQRLRLS